MSLIDNLQLTIDDCFFSNPHSAILLCEVFRYVARVLNLQSRRLRRAALSVLRDGYAVCARKTVSWGRARVANHRPGREKKFSISPPNFAHNGAILRAQTARMNHRGHPPTYRRWAGRGRRGRGLVGQGRRKRGPACYPQGGRLAQASAARPACYPCLLIAGRQAQGGRRACPPLSPKGRIRTRLMRTRGRTRWR